MRRRTLSSLVMLEIALAAGCAKKPDDAAIVSAIESRISAEADLQGASVHVTSSNGEVTIYGTVASEPAHSEAYKIAAQTPGVTKVTDLVTVGLNVLPAAHSPEAARAPTTARAEPRTSRLLRAEKPAAAPAPAAGPAPQAEVVAQAETNNPPPAPEPQPLPASPTPIAAQMLAPVAPQPREVEIATSTMARVRMVDGVDSSVNRAGEIFHATLEVPFMVDDQVIVPRGTDVYVRLVSARQAGRFKGKSELHLELVKMDFHGRSYQLVSSTYSLTGASRGKKTAKKAGAGAVLGAIIGGIAGGGAGAAVGATVGGASGAAVSAVTRGEQVKIAPETMLDFELEAPVAVTVMPRQKAATTAAQ